MQTATVSIGRNVQGVPMRTDQWHEFQLEVDNAIRSASPAVYFTGSGVGEWEGTYEDSATWVFQAPTGEALVFGLKHRLRKLAETYDQDAIALTIGNTELVGNELPLAA